MLCETKNTVRAISVRYASKLGLGIVLALLAHSATRADGISVNNLVVFAPRTSTYSTSTNTRGCPSGFVGKFSFTATLGIRAGGPAMPGITIRVLTLTNGNVLLEPGTNRVLGGTGAVMNVPRVGQYADGVLSSGESIDLPFILCLKTNQPFQFLVDVQGIVTQLVSINRAGTNSGNQASSGGSFSADGRFLAFGSDASDLAPNDTNGVADVFVRDLQNGTTTLVSVNRAGSASGNGASFSGVLSADGRFLAFASLAADLVANDTNGKSDVFVRDLQTGVTLLASVNQSGSASGNAESFSPVISANGRYVAFGSFATDLATDIAGEDLFVRDLLARTTTWVSVNRFGMTQTTRRFSSASGFSADGRYLAFQSTANDLVANDTFAFADVYVWDSQNSVNTLVSVNLIGTGSGVGNSFFPTISADGRFVAFESEAGNLAATTRDAANTGSEVFVRDLSAGVTKLVGINRTGTFGGNGPSFSPVISANGRFVAFSSGASNLVANDTNSVFVFDIFVRDLTTGTTVLASVNQAGTNGGNGVSFSSPAISADGRFVAFRSSASDLTPNDTNGTVDVFVRDLSAGTTSMVSGNRAGTNGGNAASVDPVLSPNGRFVAFNSDASDLVANDTNGKLDLLVRPLP